MLEPVKQYIKTRISSFDWFVPALVFVILLAWIFPSPGLNRDVISIKSFAGAGVSVIFFLYGLRLSFSQLLQCVSLWKVHTLVQSATFLIFPTLVALPLIFSPKLLHDPLWVGLFFLAAMPSTVSSAVVMVSMAGGNIPASLFNATFSSIAGVFITPLLIGLVLAPDSGNNGGADILIKVSLQVLLPMLSGMLLHRWYGSMAVRYRNITRYFDQSVVLSIVYTSFCASFTNGLMSDMGAVKLAVLMGVLVAIFLILNILLLVLSKLGRFQESDIITVLFCGSTKSLMHATIFLRVMYTHNPISGILLIPMLIYHAMQLTFTGAMAQRFARQKALKNES